MQDFLNKIVLNFKTHSVNEQIGISVVFCILFLLVLPNILVFGVGIFASYKLINASKWKNSAVILFSIATFFSGILLLSEDTQQRIEILDSQNTTGAYGNLPPAEQTDGIIASTTTELSTPQAEIIKLYKVVRVVDGDTLDVSIEGRTERIRLIGINTPETVDPRKLVECFGIEASNKAKELLTGKEVSLEADLSQGERDTYGRLLRYIFLENGTNFNLQIIKEGFAYEYTYDAPYKYQREFKQAQKEASENKVGLWGKVCQESTLVAPSLLDVMPPPFSAQASDKSSCLIKGNINSSGEKIFHVIGCGFYPQTKIDESRGEKWFCAEQEALNAGWRKALNCN